MYTVIEGLFLYFVIQGLHEILYYICRLTLPGRIVENGSEQGFYDADKGIYFGNFVSFVLCILHVRVTA